MTGEQEPYPTAHGVESAIKEAAKKAAQADPSLDMNKRIQLEYFNRFLSRIFSEGDDSEWVLKGGAGMLARIPSTRSTLDIDLYRRGFTLDQALEDLRRLASIDLGDHFRFEYAGHESSIEAYSQPYTDGYRVVHCVHRCREEGGCEDRSCRWRGYDGCRAILALGGCAGVA